MSNVQKKLALKTSLQIQQNIAPLLIKFQWKSHVSKLKVIPDK